MRFWRSFPGGVLVVVLVGCIVALGVVGLQVYRVTHPRRWPEAATNLGAELAKAEDVTFNSGDGIPLVGWLIPGAPGKPSIVLCHDLGATKNTLINVAIVLNQAGFTVLAIDFRDHGRSGGQGSTLGIDEARDVIAAVDFLESRALAGGTTPRVGAYGTGMGAHAIVLAAAERPALQVLVLDGLWPDAGWALTRLTFENWQFGVRHLGALPSGAFAVISGTWIAEHRAADVLPALGGRDVLLVAPAGDAKLADAMKTMYDSLPERRDSERGLLTLPAIESSGLPAAELARYHGRILQFFESRLRTR